MDLHYLPGDIYSSVCAVAEKTIGRQNLTGDEKTVN